MQACDIEMMLQEALFDRFGEGLPKKDSLQFLHDNGPEYISGLLMRWAEKRGIRIAYIQPGKPQQNAYIERYNRTVRHEWLDQNIFETIEEAQAQTSR